MSRVPGASPISTDIEEIRRRGGDEDRSLEGDDAQTVPEPALGEEPDLPEDAARRRT